MLVTFCPGNGAWPRHKQAGLASAAWGPCCFPLAGELDAPRPPWLQNEVIPGREPHLKHVLQTNILAVSTNY